MQAGKENRSFWAMAESCFLPLVLYYFVNHIVVIALTEGLQLGGVQAEIGGCLPTAVRMSGMLFGTMAVYPYYKREVGLRKKESENEKKLTLKSGIEIIVTGVIISLGFNLFFNFIGFTGKSDAYNQVAEVQFSLPLWLALPFYGVLSPVAEELVFRGVIYQALKRFVPRMTAMLGSAVLFGAFHGNIVQMVYGSVMGIIMVLFYEKYHKLWAPVFFHGAANAAVYLWTYFF